MTSRDQLFVKFAGGLFVVLLAFGVVMAAVFIWGDDDTLGYRMLAGFVSMFTGILGLGTGYLLGSTSAPVGEGVVSPDEQ